MNTGCVHSGIGHSELEKLCACVNMPSVKAPLYQRYANEVGPAVEAAAKQSCRKWAKMKFNKSLVKLRKCVNNCKNMENVFKHCFYHYLLPYYYSLYLLKIF